MPRGVSPKHAKLVCAPMCDKPVDAVPGIGCSYAEKLKEQSICTVSNESREVSSAYKSRNVTANQHHSQPDDHSAIMSSARVLLVLSLALVASAAEQPSDQGRQLSDCLSDGDLDCLRVRLLGSLYKLVQKRSLSLMEGVELQYSGDDATQVAASRAITEQNWSSLLADIFPALVRNVSFKIQEARGHKERFIFPLLAAGGFYTLLITLGVIAAKFLAFKALLVGKISLVLAAISGLAKVFNQNQNRWGPPSYAHFDSYGHHRSFDSPISN